MLSLVPRIPNRLPFPTKGFTLVNEVLSPFVGDSNGDWDLDGSGTNPASTSLVTQSLGSSLLAVVAGDLAASGIATYNGSNMDSIGTSGYASGLWPGSYTHAAANAAVTYLVITEA